MSVFKVWCEYDIGMENVVFSSEAAAVAWLEKNLANLDLDYQELKDEYLIGVDVLEVLA